MRAVKTAQEKRNKNILFGFMNMSVCEKFYFRLFGRWSLANSFNNQMTVLFHVLFFLSFILMVMERNRYGEFLTFAIVSY